MHGNTRILKAETIKLMRTTQWIYNGTNGDNVETAGPLMDAWGLGTQVITATPGRDWIFPGAVMFGHIGNSYGLISDAFMDPQGEFGVVWVTNGPRQGDSFLPSTKSAFLKPETDSFEVIQKYSRAKCIQSKAKHHHHS